MPYVPALCLGKEHKQSLSRSFQSAGGDRQESRDSTIHANRAKSYEGVPRELVQGGLSWSWQGGSARTFWTPPGFICSTQILKCHLLGEDFADLPVSSMAALHLLWA